jgi:hypothetical protein
MVPSVVPTAKSALSNAHSSDTTDPNFAQVAAAWDGLLEQIKAGLLAIIQAAGGSNA